MAMCCLWGGWIDKSKYVATGLNRAKLNTVCANTRRSRMQWCWAASAVQKITANIAGAESFQMEVE
jgi:hypothetical protein